MAEQKWDIVADLVAPSNRDLYFRALGGIHLRGEYRMSVARGKSINGAFAEVGGVIPGQRMMIHLASRHIKIIDRMTLDESKQIVEKLKRLTQTDEYRRFRFDKFLDPIQQTVTVREWPTVLWYIRRWQVTERLRLVSGGDLIPTEAGILKMCDHEAGIVVTLGDSGNVVPTNKDRPFTQLDERDLGEYEEVKKPTTSGASKS